MKYTRPAFVVFVLVTLQTAFFAELDIFGAKADIVMLLPIAAGIAGGRDRGAIVGFIAGISLDLVVHGTPTGFFALGYTLVGYIVGMMQAGVLRAAWWIPVTSMTPLRCSQIKRFLAPRGVSLAPFLAPFRTAFSPALVQQPGNT